MNTHLPKRIATAIDWVCFFVPCFKRSAFVKMAMLLMLFAFSKLDAFADGSKDLYPANATGKRALLVSSTGGLATASWPFQSRGTIKVFVKNNEYIYVGSSAQGIGAGTINIFVPSVTPNANRTNFTFSSGSGTTTGRIANRTQELAGPSPTAGGYTPYVVQNTTGTDGIFEIDFISPNPTQASTPSVPDLAGNFSWTATNTAHQPNNQPLILAWDVSVREKGLAETDLATYPFKTGRAYTNVFNGHITGDYASNTGGFNGKFFVLTKDGFAYRVSGNGQVGVGFTFFVNNRGYTTGANGTGASTYKSLNYSSAPKIKNPTEVDDVNITHKIFFTKPANDLPATALNDGATTWLKEASPQIPTVTNISFVGVEGSANYMSSKGAYIKFDSNLAGTYKITIPGNGSFIDRVLTGTSASGANQILWDGKAGLSVADPISSGAAIPPGTVLNTIKVQLFGAEVHFPFIDVEINPNGIIIEQLTTDGNYNTVANKDVVYWDDSDVTIAGNASPASSTNSNSATASSPTKPAFGISGVSSNANGHRFGKNSNNGGASGTDWGNERAIDTYSFVEGNEVSKTIAATISQADLEVTSNTPSVTAITSGNTVTYTVVIKNLNIAGVSVSDVTGAKFGFEHPEGFTVTSAVLTTNTGTIVETSPVNGATKWESTLSMTTGSEGTYVITGTVGSSLKNTALVTRATILRPADIADPNATDESTPTFSNNVDTECNGNPSGNGCNNIQAASVTVGNNPPVGVANVSSTNMNTTLTVADGATGTGGDLLVNDTDADGDALVVTKFTVVGSAGDKTLGGAGFLIPGQGTITINANGSYSFVPLTNFTGAVNTITYTLSDGIATATTTLNITVIATNTAPTGVPNTNTTPEDVTLTVTDGATGVTGDLLVNDTDPENDPLTITKFTIAGIAGDQALATPVSIINEGIITINANGSYTFVPVADYNGTVPQITYTLSDGSLTATTTLDITVTPVNDVPVVAAISKSGGEDSPIPFAAVDFTSKFTDKDNNPLTKIRIVDLPLNGSLQLNGIAITAGQEIVAADLDKITFVPNADWNGSTSFNWNGSDGTVYAVSDAPVNITVTPVNDVPVVAAISKSGGEDSPIPFAAVDFTSKFTDKDNNPLTKIRIVDLPLNGSLQLNGIAITAGQEIVAADLDKITFVPNADWNGSTSFNWNGSDGTAYAVSNAPVNITVTPVNDVPGFVKGADQNININASLQNVPLWASSITKGPLDESGQVLNFIVTNTDPSMFAVQPAILADGTLSYQPAADKFGKITVSVSLKDNGGTVNGGIDQSAVQTFTITIKPIGQADSDLTPKNTPVTTFVTVNDGASATGTTVIAGSAPAHGNIVINTDGSITYTPGDPNFVGTDTYTYRLTTPDGIVSDPITVTINVYNPAFTFTKLINGTVPNTVGASLKYNLVLTNTGNVTLNNIAVSDANAVVTGSPVTSLAPGASVTLTAVHTMTQSDIDGGSVTNQAKASGKDPKGNGVDKDSDDPSTGTPDDPTVTVIPAAPSMSLAKSVNGTVPNTVGASLKYNLVLTNTGNVTLSNIAVSDANAIVTGSPVANLAPGASVTLTAVHTMTQSDIDGGSVTNQAKATGKDPKGNGVDRDSDDPSTGSPDDPTVTIIPAAPSMSLAKTVTNVVSKVGDVINYKLIVTNTGNVTLTNVTITDAKADPGSIIPLAIAVLQPGAQVTVTARHTLALADVNSGRFANQATASGTDPKGGTVVVDSDDPSTPAAGDPTVTIITAKPAISLVKSGVLSADGNNIVYTFKIRNTGNVELAPVTLTDNKLSLNVTVASRLEPAAEVSYQYTYRVSQADRDKGMVENTAEVVGSPPSGGKVTDRSGTAEDNDQPTQTPMPQRSSISLVKTAVVSGNSINYTFTITNTGMTTLTSVTLNDAKAGISGLLLPLPTGLLPGESVNHSMVYKLSQADRDLGRVSNTAKVDALTPEGTHVGDVSGSDSTNDNPTVTPVTPSPVAVDDAASTKANQVVKIRVLDNDDAKNSGFDLSSIEITAQPKNGTLKINADGTISYEPRAGYTGGDEFTYRVKDKDGYYTNIASVKITADFNAIKVPNLFTPNGDGINDTFEIIGLNQYQSSELTIVNRWGNEVFHAKGYNNNWTGEGLNEGTYFYLLRVKRTEGSEVEVFKGYITLIRAFKK